MVLLLLTRKRPFTILKLIKLCPPYKEKKTLPGQLG